MTPAEKQQAADQLAEMREAYRPVVTAGVLGEWREAVNVVKSAQAKLDAAKQKAAARWDSGKLNQELQLAQARLKIAAKSDAGRFNMAGIDAILSEAETSKDIYKQRAAYEALQELVSLIPEGTQDQHGQDMIYRANRLAIAAAHKLHELNLTPEVLEAAKEHNAAADLLTNTKRQIIEHMEVLGDMPNDYLYNEPVRKAIEAVQQDNQGNFIFPEPE